MSRTSRNVGPSCTAAPRLLVGAEAADDEVREREEHGGDDEHRRRREERTEADGRARAPRLPARCHLV